MGQFDSIKPDRTTDGVAHTGTGTMQRVSRGSRPAGPFLRFGATRHLLFAETGTDVPFTVENYAYVDSLGRETVTWNRTFHFAERARRFDATMVYDADRGCIVDYLGTHQHIAADLPCHVDEGGGMNFVSAEQRLNEGPLRIRIGRRLTGHATVREWWDDEIGRHRISVDVHNPILGNIISYRGTFDDDVVAIGRPNAIPSDAIPVREA